MTYQFSFCFYLILLFYFGVLIVECHYGYSSLWYPSDPDWILELKSKSKVSWEEPPSYYDMPNYVLPYVDEPYGEVSEVAADSNQLQEKFLFGGNNDDNSENDMKSTKANNRVTTKKTTTSPNNGGRRTTPTNRQTMIVTSTTTTILPPTFKPPPPPLTNNTTMRPTSRPTNTTNQMPTITTTEKPSTTDSSDSTIPESNLPYENIYINSNNCSINFYFNSDTPRYFRGWTPRMMQSMPSVCVWVFYTSPTSSRRFNLEPRCTGNGVQPEGRIFSMDNSGILQRQSSLCIPQQNSFESNVALLSIYMNSTTKNQNISFRQNDMYNLAFEMQVKAEEADKSPGYYY